MGLNAGSSAPHRLARWVVGAALVATSTGCGPLSGVGEQSAEQARSPSPSGTSSSSSTDSGPGVSEPPDPATSPSPEPPPTTTVIPAGPPLASPTPVVSPPPPPSPRAALTGPSFVVGAVAVTLPGDYHFDSDQGGFKQATGPDPGIRYNPAILRLSSQGFMSRPDSHMGLIEGVCPVETLTSDLPLVGGHAGSVVRFIYRCNGTAGIDGVWTFVAWRVEDPAGPAFSADYFGHFDRRPAELTDAFQRAVWME